MRQVLWLALTVWAACSHTKTVGEPDNPRAGTTQPQTSSQVPAAPNALLQPGAAAQIQRALVDRGFLTGDYKNDELDGPTGVALRRFQSNEDLPATGIPDAETAKHLGLDPDRLFTKPLKK
jgi:hypothetical protein